MSARSRRSIAASSPCLANNGYIPVVSSVAIGPDGESYNVNADHVAGHIAAAVEAAKLVMLTDVEGIYSNYPDKASLIQRDGRGTRRGVDSPAARPSAA